MISVRYGRGSPPTSFSTFLTVCALSLAMGFGSALTKFRALETFTPERELAQRTKKDEYRMCHQYSSCSFSAIRLRINRRCYNPIYERIESLHPRSLAWNRNRSECRQNGVPMYDLHPIEKRWHRSIESHRQHPFVPFPIA